MNFIKRFFAAFFILFAFTFLGCQGNNSDTATSDTNTSVPETNTTLPPVDINATTDIKNLSIINGNVIEITGTGATKDIYIMAFNSSGSTNTAGSVTFQYPLEFINNGTFYGLIDPGTATVVDGRVHFVYTAPDDITEINGTRAEFFFYDTTNADANISLFIDFNLTGSYSSTDPILQTLILSDSNLTINSSNQVENLTLQAYTDQSTTNINTTLEIKYPQNIIDNKINIGILPATLDVVDGVVSFTYIGVTDIQATIDALSANGISNPITVNIYDAETGSNVDLNLNFEAPPAVDPKYNNYVLNIFPENNISITQNSQELVLEVYLEDSSTNLPVASESVLIDFFDVSKGTMSAFSGLTDVNGHIVFNYTAPADISNLNDLNITFKLSADINNTNYRTVSFNLNGTTKDYTGYTLATVPATATVTLPLQEKIIDVYLENNDSRPAAGETILVDYFSGENGTLNKFSAVTDENGHASFIYTAPQTLLPDGSDYNVTIRVDGTGLTAKTVVLSVLQDTAGVLSELSLLPDTIKILKTGQSNLIKILTLDANRVGVVSEIVIEQPSIDGIDYGTFNTLKITTNSDGYADVNFTAPANIDNLDNRTIVFRDVNTLVEHNLTISYEKSLNLNSDLYEIGLTQDSDIAVDSSGEVYLSIFKAQTPTELIKSWYVYDVNVSTRYGDKIYFDANNTNADSIVFSQTAEQGFSIYTKQQAAVVIVDVTADIFDGEKNVTITNSFPIVINSGELSSISMFYASTELNETINTYTDYYTVHAVDKFGNPVNSGTVIHPTLVNGVKHSSLLDINGTGELIAGAKAKFADATQNFSDVVAGADRLIVLPSTNQTNKLFFGNWEIDAVGSDLNLTDGLDENSSISLKYVIGNENRVFTNNGTDSIAVANVQAVDGVYETDSNGNLVFKVVYDPALRGKKVYIAANAETSNGKIGIAIEAVLAYTGKRLILDNKAFSINNVGESVSIDTTLYDEAYNILETYPRVTVIDFNDSIGSYSIDGTNNDIITYRAPEKLADLKALQGTTHTFKVTLEETANIYETVTVSFPNDNNYTGYTLQIIPNDFVVAGPNENKQFKVYILDANGDIVVNEQLVADFFDTKKGSMSDYFAISTSYYTNYATFTYISPDDITALENSAFDFNISMQNDKNITAPVRVNFVQRVDDINYTNYTISVLESNITIKSTLESHVVDIYLEGNDNRPAANETILLDFFDGSIGSVNSFSAITDSNGHAVFNYTSPSDLGAIDNNTTVLTFKMDNNNAKDVNVTLLVEHSSSIDPIYQDYNLSVYPDTNVSITANGQSSVIEVYLENNATNLPVSGEDVVVEFFDISKGSMNAFSGTTDGNGHIAFNYTAPDDIANANDFNITFKLKADVNNSKYTTVRFNLNATAKDYSNYTLTLVDVNRTIISANQVELFDLYLEDNSTGTPQAAVGDVITVDYFDGTLGTINSFSATTDANGHVQFTYTAPTTVADINNTSIVFRVENTTTANTYVESWFIVSENAALLSKLQLSTSSITLSQNGENVSIDVLAFNGNGEAYSGGSVTVRYPVEITNGSVSGGQFVQTSVDIVNGKATFDFIGPDPLASDPALNFIFVSSENSDINTTLTVYYVPDVPAIVFDDTNITVTQNGEVVAVGMTVYNKDNSYYPDGNITIKYPDSVLTGKNVGSFDSSSLAVENGRAVFTYTAPNPLDGNDTLTFTFYHDAQPILSQKDLNITIVPDSGQIVLTNYVLDAIYNTSMDLEVTKQMTFFVADDQGVNIADSNMTSLTVTVLNTALGSLEDSSGNTGSTLTVNNKNNVQMNVKSTTLSGVLPIQVEASFKDANNNDQNLTRVFNIVVLSGPPTAMSLSYAGTSQNSENAKFIENWVLTVTDKYNNLVNTTPAVSMGMITGYTQSSDTTANIANYLYYTSSTNDGNLTNGATDTFTSSKAPFDNVDLVNDKLVLFGGDGYRFEAYGKWDIDSFTSSELTLKDDYNGSDITELSYAVGHNFRNEWCSGSPVVANVYAKDNNNILGTTGSMIIQVEYDYYLVGKSVVLWTNLVGESNNTAGKIGLAQKVTLRGNGLTGETYQYAKGFEGVVRLNITITDTVEWYKNANFGYAVVVTGDDTNWSIQGDSMIDGNITDCTLNGGVGYVDINISDPAGNAGEIKIVNVLPSSEF